MEKESEYFKCKLALLMGDPRAIAQERFELEVIYPGITENRDRLTVTEIMKIRAKAFDFGGRIVGIEVCDQNGESIDWLVWEKFMKKYSNGWVDMAINKLQDAGIQSELKVWLKFP